MYIQANERKMPECLYSVKSSHGTEPEKRSWFTPGCKQLWKNEHRRYAAGKQRMATACPTVETFFEQVHTVDQTVLHQGFQNVFVGSRLWSRLLPPADLRLFGTEFDSHTQRHSGRDYEESKPYEQTRSQQFKQNLPPKEANPINKPESNSSNLGKGYLA